MHMCTRVSLRVDPFSLVVSDASAKEQVGSQLRWVVFPLIIGKNL